MRRARTRIAELLATIALSATLSSCGGDQPPPTKPLPKPSITDFKMVRNADHKGYTITGVLHARDIQGSLDTHVTAYPDKSCKLDTQGIDLTLDATENKPVSLKLKTAKRIGRANIEITYSAEGTGPWVTVFSSDHVIDPTAHPLSDDDKRCGGAPKKVDPIDLLPRNRQVALAINSAGFLCARVTDIYPDSAGQIIAHCVKYLSGRGRATYKIDPDAGQVEVVE